MNAGRWGLVACVLVTGYICGCRTGATIVDSSGSQIVVREIRLSVGKDLRVRDGESSRLVPLNRIFTIEIFPADFANIDGDIYYRTEIVLTNGDVIPSKPQGRPTTAFVAVNCSLSGKGKDGIVDVPLDKVSKVIVSRK